MKFKNYAASDHYHAHARVSYSLAEEAREELRQKRRAATDATKQRARSVLARAREDGQSSHPNRRFRDISPILAEALGQGAQSSRGSLGLGVGEVRGAGVTDARAR